MNEKRYFGEFLKKKGSKTKEKEELKNGIGVDVKTPFERIFLLRLHNLFTPV